MEKVQLLAILCTLLIILSVYLSINLVLTKIDLNSQYSVIKELKLENSILKNRWKGAETKEQAITEAYNELLNSTTELDKKYTELEAKYKDLKVRYYEAVTKGGKEAC